MYEPKLPVTGVSFLALGMSSILGKAIVLLLITTLSIILFRFIRLLIKEGNLKNLLKVLGVFSLVLLILIGIGKTESNNMIKESEEIFYEYKSNLEVEEDEKIVDEVELKSGDIIGILSIENISLELPIIVDANDENLWAGAAHINGTPYYWEKGNSFISSHNIKTYGKLFNRLNELSVGDKIVILDSNNKFDYIVYDIEIVNPDDTKCFDKIKGEYNLSMVTCTKAGSKRLIIYSERV